VAGRLAGLTCLHPGGVRAAAAEGSALLGTGRTMKTCPRCQDLSSMSLDSFKKPKENKLIDSEKHPQEREQTAK
jgi:hypothetical protein